jgi:ABC-type Fe3+ transport system permease subunit
MANQSRARGQKSSQKNSGKRASASISSSSSRATRKYQGEDEESVLKVNRGGSSDRFDWYSLYIYAICLITVLICLFALVSLVRSIVDSVWPDAGYFDPYSVPKDSSLSAEQVKKNLADQNQRQAIKSVVNSLTTLVIAGPIYLYHWKLARKSRS